MKKFLFFLILYTIVLSAFAQVPIKFKYQSVVRDQTGTLLTNQNVNFQISILKGNSDGIVCYTELHNIITNDFGLSTFEIGNGINTYGNIDTIQWGSDAYYVKIELDPNGGTSFTEMGTSQLISVPYALFAQKAKQSGIAGNGIIFSGDSIINSAPDKVITIVGNGTTVVTGTYPNFIIKSSDSTKWKTIGDNLVNSNSGNVGIGSINPNSKLEVMGTSNLLNDTLFQVKDSQGNPVFVVFPSGVKVIVPEESNKAAIGGFAVSGRSTNKATSSEYLVVTPDSVRVYIKEVGSKAAVGGFAVSGRSTNKASSDEFLRVTGDSTRVFTKSKKAGFGVINKNNFGAASSYIDITPENMFIGEGAGKTLTSIDSAGIHNSFFGYRSGYSTSNGSYNVFFGYTSGYLNSGGHDNVFLGNSSGYNNLSGNQNIFLGSGAGRENRNASQNVFLGYKAGYANISGPYNVFIGSESGYNSTSGRSNIFLGSATGYSNGSGHYNVFIGENSGYLNTTGSNSVFLGYKSGYNETKSNRLYIENSPADSANALIYGEFDRDIIMLNGYVGIGKAPATGYRVDVNGTIRATNFIGDGSGLGGITGATGGISNTGSTTIAADTDVDGVGDIYFYTHLLPRMIITNAGNIGINNLSPSKKVEIDGDININGTIYNNGSVFTGSGGYFSPSSGNNIFNNNPGNVGIGTSTDVGTIARLHVKGKTNNNSTKAFKVSNTDDIEMFNITDGSFVGINVASPQAFMHIRGANNADTIGSQELIRISRNSGALTGSTSAGIFLGNASASSDSKARLDFVLSDPVLGGSTPKRTVLTLLGNGNIGINKTNPTQALDVVGNINYSGSLLKNGLPFNESQWTTAGSNLYYNTGNVGIGNINPNALLDIAFSTAGGDKTGLMVQTTAGGTGSTIRLKHGGTDGRDWWITSTGSGNACGYAGALQIYDNNSNAVRMLIDATGNVGIGSNNPTQKLDVQGNIIIKNSTNSTNKYEIIVNRGKINFSSVTGDANHSIYNNYANLDGEGSWDGIKMNTYEGINIRVGAVGGTNGLFINSSGNASFGSTTPSHKLEVFTNSVYSPSNLAVFNNYIGYNNSGGDYEMAAIRLGNKVGGWASISSKIANGCWGDQVRLDFSTPLASNNNTQIIRMSIMPFNGRVGIGTVSPGASSDIGPLLHVKSNESSASNWSGRIIASGPIKATFLGEWQGNSIVGSHNTALDAWTDLCINPGANTIVGGYTSYGYKLYVNGAAYSTGGWAGSDIRWKKEIKTLENSFDKILQLSPVTYYWKLDEFAEMGFDTTKQIGLIAQDVEKLFPELVKTNDAGFKSISYEKLTVVLIQAIKEQQKIIVNQEFKTATNEQKLLQLEKENAILKAQMMNLDNNLNTLKADLESIKEILIQTSSK